MITRLCIKPVFITPKTFKVMKKILVAYDGSENASKALSLAAHFASNLKLPLVIMNVNDSEEEGRSILSEAREYLNAYQIPKLEDKIVQGVADERIVQISSELNADLIVMGSYGHSRIREAILGSTTVQTMRKATVPVLMAR